MKGFYNTNLNKEKNYMKDIEKMKKTNNLNYQNEEDLMINPEDFMYKKKKFKNYLNLLNLFLKMMILQILLLL